MSSHVMHEAVLFIARQLTETTGPERSRKKRGRSGRQCTCADCLSFIHVRIRRLSTLTSVYSGEGRNETTLALGSRVRVALLCRKCVSQKKVGLHGPGRNLMFVHVWAFLSASRKRQQGRRSMPSGSLSRSGSFRKRVTRLSKEVIRRATRPSGESIDAAPFKSSREALTSKSRGRGPDTPRRAART